MHVTKATVRSNRFARTNDCARLAHAAQLQASQRAAGIRSINLSAYALRQLSNGQRIVPAVGFVPRLLASEQLRARPAFHRGRAVRPRGGTSTCLLTDLEKGSTNGCL